MSKAKLINSLSNILSPSKPSLLAIKKHHPQKSAQINDNEHNNQICNHHHIATSSNNLNYCTKSSNYNSMSEFSKTLMLNHNPRKEVKFNNRYQSIDSQIKESNTFPLICLNNLRQNSGVNTMESTSSKNK